MASTVRYFVVHMNVEHPEDERDRSDTADDIWGLLDRDGLPVEVVMPVMADDARVAAIHDACARQIPEVVIRRVLAHAYTPAWRP